MANNIFSPLGALSTVLGGSGGQRGRAEGGAPKPYSHRMSPPTKEGDVAGQKWTRTLEPRSETNIGEPVGPLSRTGVSGSVKLSRLLNVTTNKINEINLMAERLGDPGKTVGYIQRLATAYRQLRDSLPDESKAVLMQVLPESRSQSNVARDIELISRLLGQDVGGRPLIERLSSQANRDRFRQGFSRQKGATTEASQKSHANALRELRRLEKYAAEVMGRADVRKSIGSLSTGNIAGSDALRVPTTARQARTGVGTITMREGYELPDRYSLAPEVVSQHAESIPIYDDTGRVIGHETVTPVVRERLVEGKWEPVYPVDWQSPRSQSTHAAQLNWAHIRDQMLRNATTANDLAIQWNTQAKQYLLEYVPRDAASDQEKAVELMRIMLSEPAVRQSFSPRNPAGAQDSDLVNKIFDFTGLKRDARAVAVGKEIAQQLSEAKDVATLTALFKSYVSPQQSPQTPDAKRKTAEDVYHGLIVAEMLLRQRINRPGVWSVSSGMESDVVNEAFLRALMDTEPDTASYRTLQLARSVAAGDHLWDAGLKTMTRYGPMDLQLRRVALDLAREQASKLGLAATAKADYEKEMAEAEQMKNSGADEELVRRKIAEAQRKYDKVTKLPPGLREVSKYRVPDTGVVRRPPLPVPDDMISGGQVDWTKYTEYLIRSLDDSPMLQDWWEQEKGNLARAARYASRSGVPESNSITLVTGPSAELMAQITRQYQQDSGAEKRTEEQWDEYERGLVKKYQRRDKGQVDWWNSHRKELRSLHKGNRKVEDATISAVPYQAVTNADIAAAVVDGVKRGVIAAPRPQSMPATTELGYVWTDMMGAFMRQPDDFPIDSSGLDALLASGANIPESLREFAWRIKQGQSQAEAGREASQNMEVEVDLDELAARVASSPVPEYRRDPGDEDPDAPASESQFEFMDDIRDMMAEFRSGAEEADPGEVLDIAEEIRQRASERVESPDITSPLQGPALSLRSKYREDQLLPLGPPISRHRSGPIIPELRFLGYDPAPSRESRFSFTDPVTGRRIATDITRLPAGTVGADVSLQEAVDLARDTMEQAQREFPGLPQEEYLRAARYRLQDALPPELIQRLFSG